MNDTHALRTLARTCLFVAGLARAAGYIEVARRCVDHAVAVFVALATGRAGEQAPSVARGRLLSPRRSVEELRKEACRCCSRAAFAFARGRSRVGSRFVERTARLIRAIRDQLVDRRWLSHDLQQQIAAGSSPPRVEHDGGRKFDA